MVSTDITDPKVGIARNASSKFKPVNVDGVRYESIKSAASHIGQAKHGDYAGAMKGIERIYSRG